jgi:hypothetical protein
MLGPTVVEGSSMVMAMRGFSGAAWARGGRDEAATSVLRLWRNSRRRMGELYIEEKAMRNRPLRQIEEGFLSRRIEKSAPTARPTAGSE